MQLHEQNRVQLKVVKKYIYSVKLQPRTNGAINSDIKYSNTV